MSNERFIDRLVDVSDQAGRYHIKTPVPPPLPDRVVGCTCGAGQSPNHAPRCTAMSAAAGRTIVTSPWDSCEIRYRVRSRDAAQDLTINPAMPAGWKLLRADPLPVDAPPFIAGRNGYDLVFEVHGEVSDRDGVIVHSLLERLGMR